MSGYSNTTIDRIVENLKFEKADGRACSLLIGAGCSYSAGIPLASGFVDLIREKFSSVYATATPKDYPTLMGQLTVVQCRSLVAAAIQNARINWAHIAIAQLMKHGYVDRVFTTNFDPLVMRACALIGEFPAVYDFSTRQTYRPGFAAKRAVYHLHGQSEGFLHLHTSAEVEQHRTNIEPLFGDAAGRMWLVSGYSGLCDPVVDHLGRIDLFLNGLTWVNHNEDEPGGHLQGSLLADGKGSAYLRGYNSDQLFVTLAQRLDCFPPDFISAPFQHLRDTLNRVGPFQLPHKAGQLDIVQVARKRNDHAESVVDDVADTTRERVLLAMSRGDYEEAVRDVSEGAIAQDNELRNMVAPARFLLGVDSHEKSASLSGDDRERALNTAIKHYENSLAIKPDMYESLYNWGVALADLAKAKGGENAQRLFDLARQKFAESNSIRPDRPEALENWGNALASLAKLKGGAEAKRLFSQAKEKCRIALSLTPDNPSILYNLSCLYGLRRDETACRTWLTRCLSIPHHNAKRLLATDTDFDSMRDKPWFQEMLAAL